ncbi:MAG: hypothetical protein ACK56I_24180, partial [bacterium]
MKTKSPAISAAAWPPAGSSSRKSSLYVDGKPFALHQRPFTVGERNHQSHHQHGGHGRLPQAQA